MVKLNIELTEDQIMEIVKSGYLEMRVYVTGNSCSTEPSDEGWPDAKKNDWAERLIEVMKEAGLSPDELPKLSKWRVAKFCRSSDIFNGKCRRQRTLIERVEEIEEVFGFKFCDVDEIDSEVLTLIDEKQPLLAPGEDRTKSAVNMNRLYCRQLLSRYAVYTMTDLRSCHPKEGILVRLNSDLGLSA